MGYTTEFWGQIDVVPALNEKEIEYLTKFSETRRMLRKNGDYYLGKGMCGQDHEEDIIDYNAPPFEQPSLWCQWIPTEDGRYIEWNTAEKFYYSAEWMWYVIQHFLKPNPIAKIRYPDQFYFLIGHKCDGVIDAQGEEGDDRWKLIVKDNEVFVQRGEVIYSDDIPVGNKDLELQYCFEQNKDSKKCLSCDTRFKCYTNEKQPTLRYGTFGAQSFWQG